MKQKLILTGAFLFFLLVQWYGIYFMLYNHPGPLGLDDSASYIEQINYFRAFPFSSPSGSPTNINKFLHPWLFGSLASLTPLNAVEMFHLNFYIGMFLMAVTLLLFFRKTDTSAAFIITAFFLLAFHEGKGTYHGFFWVVPSFYAIMLFLLSAVALFYSKHHYRYAIPLIILLLITHSTGIYLASLLLLALVMHEFAFKKNQAGLKKALIIASIGIATLLFGEYLHAIKLLPASFSSSFRSYQKIDSIGLFTQTVPLQQRLAAAGSEILKTAQRYDFTKYFFGLYTPLVAYGLYHAIKEKKNVLVSLFAAALLGQIILSPLSTHAYRFFYPLEILTWIVIAFGISRLALNLVSSTRLTWKHTGQGLLLALAVLFTYNAIHRKADHSWFFKFYAPRFVNESALHEYLTALQDKRIAVYNTPSRQLAGLYLGMEGARKTLHFSFNPSGKQLSKLPDQWIIIGENHKLFQGLQNGWHVALPQNSALEFRTPPLHAGRYRLELTDNHIPSIEGLSVKTNGKTAAIWHEEPFEVRFPEEDQYPPILMPWHWNGDTPWLLHKRPLHQMGLVREGKRYSIDLELREGTTTLRLHNTGPDKYLLGAMELINLATNEGHRYDFYWGEESILKYDLALIKGNTKHPLLWTDPRNRPGKQYLFRLERTFKDVKAFSYYGKASEL